MKNCGDFISEVRAKILWKQGNTGNTFLRGDWSGRAGLINILEEVLSSWYQKETNYS